MTKTAEQRRDESRQEYNANLKECPGHQLLATLSDKWVTLVLDALADGPLRYNELSTRRRRREPEDADPDAAHA